MTVWITRTRPGADQTAVRLKALGVDSLIDPLLEVRVIDNTFDLRDFDALAFTSPNGVEAFARLSKDRNRPVFAVGEATAAASRCIGFEQVEAADGDLKALARLLALRRPGRVLALGPTEPSGDLAALSDGVPVTARAIYETVARAPLIAGGASDLVAVTIHSAKAGRVLAAGDRDLAELAVIALSEGCAEPLRGRAVKSIAVAPFPDDASLVRLTADVLSKAP